MVFLGYGTGSKAYKVFDPVTRHVYAMRDPCSMSQRAGSDSRQTTTPTMISSSTTPSQGNS
jgi:hypothetical protein